MPSQIRIGRESGTGTENLPKLSLRFSRGTLRGSLKFGVRKREFDIAIGSGLR